MAKEYSADLDELNSKVNIDSEEDEGGGEVDFVTLLIVARKSLIWIVLLILLGLTASYLFLRYTKPVYQSSSILKINEQSEANALGLGGALGEAASNKKNIESLSGEVELIKSNLIYEKLKEKLDITVSYYLVGNVLNEERYKTSPFRIKYTIRDESFYNKRFNIDFLENDQFRLSYLVGEQEIVEEHKIGEPIHKNEIDLIITKTSFFDENVLDQNFYFVINSNSALNDYFNENLAVEIINPDAHTIGISFTDYNPLKAVDIINKIDSVYLEQKLRQKDLATRQTLDFLDEQLQETRDNLQQSENQMESFVRKNKTYDVKADVGKSMERLEEFQKERLELGVQISLLKEVLNLVNRNSNLEEVIPSLKEVEDSELSERVTQLSDMQLNYKLLLRSYKPTTEAVQLYQKEIEFTKQAVVKLLQQNIDLLQKQSVTIANNMRAIESNLQQMPEKETERGRLQRLFDLYEKYYLTLMDKKVEFGIARAGTTPDFQILSSASVPKAPISPNRLIIYAIGLGAGLFLGIGLIGARYLMHNTISNISEVERNVKAPILGIVPRYHKEKLAASKLIINKNPKSSISESFRSIRTNLDFISSAKSKRLISVTSTVSGEGKTFVAVNLGGIIAMSNQKVVVLDLDLRKPKVNIAFDAENSVGVSTILIDKSSVQECIRNTPIPNLDFISAGPTPPNPSELILNSKFEEMLQELYQLYDVIIVDTPPIGLVTDGILIMRKADIPLFIVRADYSKKGFLKNLSKVIKTHNFNKLSIILNDANASNGYGYGYGYGYDYGYGSSYYEEDEVKESFLTRLRRNFT
ncbi:GumC family protein [Adhaeribacter aquaticus]|uniref:GumC family protein n=1 Tax=Adhaeribacter aquaticus TaxID=299567 RepID=UPI000406AD9A|nr:tyrosine-protein kinase [Adhaeribacter aquaticus]